MDCLSAHLLAYSLLLEVYIKTADKPLRSPFILQACRLHSYLSYHLSDHLFASSSHSFCKQNGIAFQLTPWFAAWIEDCSSGYTSYYFKYLPDSSQQFAGWLHIPGWLYLPGSNQLSQIRNLKTATKLPSPNSNSDQLKNQLESLSAHLLTCSLHSYCWQASWNAFQLTSWLAAYILTADKQGESPFSSPLGFQLTEDKQDGWRYT